MLLCISNLAELKGSTIPKIVNLFENAFELSFTDNLKVKLLSCGNYLPSRSSRALPSPHSSILGGISELLFCAIALFLVGTLEF